jgi:hypothetical protein
MEKARELVDYKYPMPPRIIAQALDDAEAPLLEALRDFNTALGWALSTIDILMRNDAMEPATFERYEFARALLRERGVEEVDDD